MKHAIKYEKVFENDAVNVFYLNYMVGKEEASLLKFFCGPNTPEFVRQKADAHSQDFLSIAEFCLYNLYFCEDIIYLTTLATKPKHRGNEYASMLLFEVIHTANKLNAIIVLKCGADNLSEQQFKVLQDYYKQHGFLSFKSNEKMMYYDEFKRIF